MADASQKEEPKGFNPYRFLMAREFNGFSQAVLAEKLGLNELDISNIEQGYYEVDQALLQEAVMALGFPEGFFYRPDPPVFPRPICPKLHKAWDEIEARNAKSRGKQRQSR
jgi:transcriptional regulator with XRE-family HTH domain